MKASFAIRHEFVEYIPDALEEGVLYISIPFRTVNHRCFCGCGSEVVTPLGPTDWELTFDGVSVSLYPSVGSWQLPCKSHYWIRHNIVEWARRWSKRESDAGKARDRRAKRQYYGTRTEGDRSN